jgi:hypothetical protein
MTCKEFDYDCEDCVNAWDLSREYSCKESPKCVNSVNEINVGEYVEANQGAERFWVVVTDVCGCYIIGVVITDLKLSHPFTVGEKVKIGLQQIYNVRK